MKRVVFLLLLFCPPLWAKPLDISVSVLVQKTFVQALTGDLAEVHVVVGPGFNPATYQPTPRQISRLARSVLWIRAGMPFEEAWLPRLKSINPELVIMDMREGLELLSGEQGETDPHIWTDPVLVQTFARHLRDQLIRLLPRHKDLINNNYQRFTQRLQQLDAELRQQLAPMQGRSFLVFHPAWSYFAQRYGLRQLAIEHEGKMPNARRLGQLIDQAKALGIKNIIVQPQHNSASAQTIARAIGAHMVSIDPLAADYFAEMHRLAHVLRTP